MSPVAFIVENININKIDVPEEVQQWTSLPDRNLIRWRFQVAFTREVLTNSPDKFTILTIALLERLSDKKILTTININTVYRLPQPIPTAQRVHFLNVLSDYALNHLEGVCSQALANTVYIDQLPACILDKREEMIHDFLRQYWN